MFSWICPLCANSLHPSTTAWRCDQGHNFDRAKSGYTNLLPAQHKSSREPGDSKAMLLARRDFLNAGHYNPVVNGITATIADLPLSSDGNGPHQLLDCGCGEGYYLQQLGNELALNWEFAGVDISKSAVELAAKRKQPKATWACASSLRLPLANACIDVALRIFSPENNDELKRVLRKEGYMIVVTPADNHLIEIKSALYADLKPYSKVTTPDGFGLVGQRTVEQTVNLDTNESIVQLMSMTPFLWNGRREARDQLLQQNALSVTLHVLVSCYQLIGRNGNKL